jgi:UDP-N-acetylmuramate dehydrogenase
VISSTPPCAYREKVSLATCSSWKIGGPATLLCEPDSVQELQRLFEWLKTKAMPFEMVGAGSNLLFADRGFDGAVIRLGTGFAFVQCDGTKLHGGAALSAVKLARATAEAGLEGMEFAAGLPATLGGMLAMNAGAYGQEISDGLTRLHLMWSDGRSEWIDRSDLEPSYRHMSGLKGAFILAAEFELPLGTKEQIQARTAQWLTERRAKQPLSEATCGSVFKRPANDFPGRLIEAAGLKSFHVGAIRVSEKHANFFVNEGGGRAVDVLALVETVKAKVQNHFGVCLEEEFRYVS